MWLFELVLRSINLPIKLLRGPELIAKLAAMSNATPLSPIVKQGLECPTGYLVYFVAPVIRIA